MDVTVQDMMAARDRRAARQRELLAEYGQTLLCFTMNIPGPEKENGLIREGFGLGRRFLAQAFLRLGIQPTHEEERIAFTGCEGFYVLPLSPLAVKQMAADIEEATPAGRLFDLDVLRPDGVKVERREIGLPGRACLLCGRDAQACARSRAHSVSELREKTDSLLREAIREQTCRDVARAAVRALLYEVLTTPKPGLVDRNHTGSHRDMDVFTFADSVSALQPYFFRCAAIGFDGASDTPEAVFERLRRPGRVAEGAMLEATRGVNTHRGAVFSLGILSAAAGRLEKGKWQPEALLDACAAMARGLTERDFRGLTPQTARTFGEKLYLARGIAGVRGEAEKGFPLVRDTGYPKLAAGLAAGLSLNDAGCAALIALIAKNEDTNVFHRGGEKAHKALTRAAGALLRKEPFPSAASIRALDAELIRHNISPGGSADLLALCFMLHFLREAAS